MICNHCRRESNPVSHVCPYCGQFMGEVPPIRDSVPISTIATTALAQGREARGAAPARKAPSRQ